MVFKLNIGINKLNNILYTKIQNNDKKENKEKSNELLNKSQSKDNINVTSSQKIPSSLLKIDINTEDNFNKEFESLDNNLKKIFLEISNGLDTNNKKILENILTDKTLLIKDTDNNTILENLLSIKNSKNIDGNKLFIETIKMLQKSDINQIIKMSENAKDSNTSNNGINRSIDKKNNIYQEGVSPTGGIKEITQCTSRYTCGAASMQVYFQNEKPEFLVKLIKDLAMDNKSKFSNISFTNPSDSFELASGKEKDSKEDRSSIDILIQSAIMNKVNLSLKFFNSEYDVLKDYETGKTVKDIWSKLNGNGGGNPKRMAKVMTQITDKKFDYIHSINLTGGILEKAYGIGAPAYNENVLKKLDEQIEKGNKTIIAYNTNPNDPLGLHYVTVLGKNSKGEYCFVDTDQNKETGSIIFSMNRKEMLEKIRALVYQKE